MKNSLLLFGIISCCSAANAQSGHSLLWKLTPPKGKKISYLFGTMHTNDSLCNTWSDAWWQAFNSCNTVAGETSMTPDMKDAMSALKLSMMTDTVLSDLFTPTDFRFVDSVLTACLPLELAIFKNKLKPVITLVGLMETPDNSGPYGELMDVRIQRLAAANGKTIAGLETATEQILSLDVLNLNEQAALMLATLRDENGLDERMDEMINAYVSQDFDQLASLDMMEMYPDKLMDELLEQRNQRFIDHLLPLLKDNKVFCAVGALHLPGDTGMIEMLRNAGYNVEPVEFSFTKSSLEQF